MTPGGCAAIAACIGLSLPFTLRAQSVSWNGTAALSSQLVDRGLAITPSTPIAQLALDVGLPSNWSVGAQASSEVRSPAPIAEGIVDASHNWALSADWQMQATLAYYNYPSSQRAKLFDRAEASVSWSYRDVLTAGLSAFYGLQAGDHQWRGAADVDFHWPLPWQFSFAAGIGVAQYASVGYEALYGDYDKYYYAGEYATYVRQIRTVTYGYGHLGLAWSHGPWRVELDRIAVDPDGRRHLDNLVSEPWVATIAFSF